jgi:hypothetical protein
LQRGQDLAVVLEDRQMAARYVEELGAGGACREFAGVGRVDEPVDGSLTWVMIGPLNV